MSLLWLCYFEPIRVESNPIYVKRQRIAKWQWHEGCIQHDTWRNDARSDQTASDDGRPKTWYSFSLPLVLLYCVQWEVWEIFRSNPFNVHKMVVKSKGDGMTTSLLGSVVLRPSMLPLQLGGADSKIGCLSNSSHIHDCINPDRTSRVRSWAKPDIWKWRTFFPPRHWSNKSNLGICISMRESNCRWHFSQRTKTEFKRLSSPLVPSAQSYNE